MAKKAKKGGPIRVDFTGVEGKRSVLPNDDYLVEIEEVEVKEGSNAPYFEVTMVVQDGKFKGQKIWDRLSTSPNALWKLRSFLEIIGMEVPDEEMEIDKDDMVGTKLVVTTAQEKYTNDDDEKKIAVRVVDFYSADDFEAGDDGSDDDDDDEPKAKKGKKADKKSKKDDDDDGDDDDGDDGDDDDDDEPKAKKGKKGKKADDDDDETPEERKKRLRKERRAARKGGKSKDDDDSNDDDDDDGDKKAKKGKKGKKAEKVSADTVNDADEDDLEKIIKNAGIEVDLDDYKTLRKKQAAVIDALEEAELLEEDDE